MEGMTTSLSELDRAAVLAYESHLGRTMNDPNRVRAVYTAKFRAEPMREQIKLVCQTGRNMLNVEGCEANLVSATEQFNICEGCSIDAHQGFCRYVVNERAPFGVEDSHKHALVCDLKATTEQGVRSYLGVPLICDDYAVGAFCVYTNVERIWLPFEVQVLAGLAATVVDLIGDDTAVV